MHTIPVSRTEIEKDLQSYVQSAAMPCPYAKLPTSYLYLEHGIETERARDELKAALDEFWANEHISILAVVPQAQPDSHREAREQAYLLRYHLHYLHLQASGALDGRAEEIDARLRKQYTDWAADEPSFLGPRVAVGRADILMTAFNPLYDADHARYAPHSFFPVIRTRDLMKIHERQPELSRRIASHSKCKIILSILKDRSDIDLEQMLEEYPAWLHALGYYSDFVTGVYTDSYRIDPRTLPRLHENRQFSNECMSSERFKGSLIAYRIIIDNMPDVPVLRRILSRNPEVSVFDIAKIVYGDVAGMYVPP